MYLIMKLIIEDGYNSDYLSILCVAIFWNHHNSIASIINANMLNSDIYYLQEFINIHIISQIQSNNIIEARAINKLRLYLYNCGWLKSQNMHILSKMTIKDFYAFLFISMFGHTLDFTCDDNTHITHKYIEITPAITENKKYQNIQTLVDKWINLNVCGSFKFASKINLIPIFVDIQKNSKNETRINILEQINIGNLLFFIHSVICQTVDGNYYVLIPDKNCDNWYALSDKSIQLFVPVDMSNPKIVRQITDELVCLFYAL